MQLHEVRQAYLNFFKARGHVEIPSDSLVPKNDPTTLFTGSGMQPLVPYLLGQMHPAGSRLVDSQKCFRSGDIEEVGDNRHITFFEMLGNWSLGDYFKQEQLRWVFDFLTGELGLEPQRLYVTAYIGDEKNGVPRDTESAEIWKKLFAEKGIDAKEVALGTEEEGYQRGMQDGRIFFYGDKNWWSRVGAPKNMPAGEPGGPDSEVFYDFGTPHDPKWGPECHPNCDCGRFLEICNAVFMEYIREVDGNFGPLPKKNVDFGGGLERLVMAQNNSTDIILSCHKPILEYLEKTSGKTYESDVHSFRIIADHMKAAVFLIADGVLPGPADQGYFVRRLIRRSVRYADKLGIAEAGFAQVVRPIAEMYQDQYPEVLAKAGEIESTIAAEEEKFRKTLARGLKEFQKYVQKGSISGSEAFTLFSSYGFPLELIVELAPPGLSIDLIGFGLELKRHQDLSRTGSEQKFKGGLADASEATTRLHTAHHLLLKALQLVLGHHVKQRGSNITGERLRIDFSHDEKMTTEQIAEVERIVNKKINEQLPVIRSELKKEDAEQLGAQHEFGTKYPDIVSVYSIGPVDATAEAPQFDKAFSIEFCGGPHVRNTADLAGTFKVQKEEASSAGVRRIKAVLE